MADNIDLNEISKYLREQPSNAARQDGFVEWLDNIFTDGEYLLEPAVRRIVNLQPDIVNSQFSDEYDLLHLALLECWNAKNWNTPGHIYHDRSQERRAKLSDALDNAKKAGKKIGEAAKLIDNEFLRIDLDSAFHQLEEKGITVNHSHLSETAWKIILAELHRALTQSVSQASSASLLYSYTYAGLYSEDILTSKRKVEIRTALLLRLVFLFRTATSRTAGRLALGQEMPKGGKPCHSAASSLVNLTFPDKDADMDAAEAKTLEKARRDKWRLGEWGIG